ncbi:hypothetical protein X777_10955 [Ooceraea biroi]|uniref:Uncharacterized protein n=1 Tax=Ooceraea biroi TaxID=2015173 RepID=A0A026W6G4_OOCBI|nr:hypothetical protein X777_10955 [Ooceraea biroi]
MEHANCIPANSTSTLSPDADRRDLRLDADAHRRFGERPSREPGRGIEGTMGLPMISVAVFFVSAKQESAMLIRGQKKPLQASPHVTTIASTSFEGNPKR